MRKAVAFLLALLMIPFASSVSAESNLLEVGIVDTIDSKLVHISFSSESTVVTLTEDGNLSEHFWGSGELITQWSIELNITARAASSDSTGLQYAVAHNGGVYVINMELRIAIRNYTTNNVVDQVEWDSEGDLWFGHYGGERRAKEYDETMHTSFKTENHNTALTSMTILSEDRIATGGRDNLVKIHEKDGTLSRSIADFSSYPTILERDSNGNMIVGCANGKLYRYDTSDWSYEEMTISSTQSINSITFDNGGDLFVGTSNGNLHVVDVNNFTEQDAYSSPGKVMMAAYGVDGELFIVSAFTTSTKIRLFDLDSDSDGVTDTLDAFPNDSTQNLDTDGDGYGDSATGNNPDRFPLDETQWVDTDGDGYGDNPTGNNSDAFPSNPNQWQDSDGDGYGDISNAEQGDRYPDDPNEWVDSDSDGIGDNGDDCPTINGFSTEDRQGCKDSDNDGYSDPDDDWSIDDGADSDISDKSQWEDRDGDGYGDNLTGYRPDSCPLEAGNSTKAWMPTLSEDGNLSLEFTIQDKYGCLDTDGDGFYDFGDQLPNDASDYSDADGDGIGAKNDYNDSNSAIQTRDQHCEMIVSDNSEYCQGTRDMDYQNYVKEQDESGEYAVTYGSWKSSRIANEAEGDKTDQYLETATEILPMLGIGFAAIIGVLLIYAGINKARRRRALVKTYGVPFVPSENSAEKEALEGRAGLSAKGGVDSDKLWEDEVEPMELEGDDGEMLGDGFGDIELKSEDSMSDNEDIMEEESSIEELAGLPEPTSQSDDSELESIVQEAPEAPPLPPEGLPEGWTMDQWQWYGAEWLAKSNK
ncbi:MAG: hypothetical protein QGI21_03890 [Candidatus Poseidoniaceae archaeon]|jgi:hypothetical protein|nr:hypothetical protein [Candidatus Poseidoniaceae archaeon]